jgi:FlaA1/EpsC-like NDP-sugar epimerase
MLVDVCDRAALQRVFERHRPQVVFHAAAHKHVPILELFAEEAVKTNVIGTANVIAGARQNGVERFVLISTDKAVDPSSVMGASKRVAEMMVQSAADAAGDKMVFSAVRFGNVLGSRGSVVPTFMRQIQEGGPVTVSDPEMLRYFMLTSEAVELVLQASALAQGGEIFVLDMGLPVRIGDLAHRMIRLSGLVPGRDIEVRVTGARPGEKIMEILSRQPMTSSPHPRISIAAAPHPGPVTMLDAVRLLESGAERGDRSVLREMLMTLSWQTWDGDETIDLEALAGVGESA